VTAASQVRGGVVWGLGGALREASEVDKRYGGFFNATLEEYPISVNADIAQIEIDFIDEPDPLLNPLGVKGLGEVATVGVAPAVANAVYHATGQRCRRLPITIADLL
jgi:xanthine dehydrogenase YagR molybdenum-binding subunit